MVDKCQDLSVLTGATLIDDNMDPEQWSVDMLGGCASAVIDAESTIIAGGHGKKKRKAERVEHIKHLMMLERRPTERKDL